MRTTLVLIFSDGLFDDFFFRPVFHSHIWSSFSFRRFSFIVGRKWLSLLEGIPAWHPEGLMGCSTLMASLLHFFLGLYQIQILFGNSHPEAPKVCIRGAAWNCPSNKYEVDFVRNYISKWIERQFIFDESGRITNAFERKFTYDALQTVSWDTFRQSWGYNLNGRRFDVDVPHIHTHTLTFECACVSSRGLVIYINNWSWKATERFISFKC